MNIHIWSHQVMQPFKTDKSEIYFWLNGIGSCPTGKQCPDAFENENQAEKNSEHNQLCVVDRTKNFIQPHVGYNFWCIINPGSKHFSDCLKNQKFLPHEFYLP